VDKGILLLEENRLFSLLLPDALRLLIVPFYYPIFLSIYAGLNVSYTGIVSIGTLLALSGVTLFLVTPSAFSWIPLSNKYAVATTASQEA